MSRANESAMPAQGCYLDSDGRFEMTVAHHGLTIREHFAAMAMQGFISGGWDSKGNEGDTAEMAVLFADALLAELAKP